MAKIPVYEERQQVGGGFQPGRLSVPDANLGAVPRALQQAGGAVFDYGLEMAKAETEKVMSDATLHWEQYLPQAKSAAQPGAKDFVPTIQSEFDSWSEQTLKGISDGAVRNQTAKQILRLRDNVLSDSIRFQSDQGRTYRYDLAVQSNQSIASAINLNPSLFDELTAARIEAIDAMFLEPDKKQTLKNQLLQQNADAALRKIIETDPMGFLNEVRQSSASVPFTDVARLYPIVAKHESQFDPNAISPVGAVGYMQVMPNTARNPGYGVPDIFEMARAMDISFGDRTDAEIKRLLQIQELNQAFGEKYLNAMLNNYDNNLVYALSAYNWGPGATNRWIADGAKPESLPNETRTYVKKITKDLGHPGFAAQDGTFSGNKYLDLLPVDKRKSYISAANSAVNQHQSLYRGQINSRMKNDSVMAADGIVSPNPVTETEFMAAYGSDGQQMYSDYVAEQQMAQTIAEWSDTPASNILNQIIRPEPGSDYSFQKDIQRKQIAAAQNIMRMREDDAAMYVLNNSQSVASAYQEYDAIDPFDASLMPAERDLLIKQKQAAAEVYANAILQEQDRLGIQNQGILTKPVLDELARQYLKTPQGEPTAENVQMMSSMWGNAWPSVYQQLIAEGAMPPAAIVIGSGLGDREAVDVVDASRRTVDEWLINKEPKVKSDLRLDVIDELDPLMKTLIGSDGQPRMAGGFEAYEVRLNTANQLAAMYVAQGESVTKAARRASAIVGLDKYHFNESYRVPIEEDMNAVRYGTAIALRELQPEDLFPSMADLAMEQTQAEQLRELRRNGYWVTDESETGLYLYSPNTRSAVLDNKGRPIRFTWDQLTSYGYERTREIEQGMMIAP